MNSNDDQFLLESPSCHMKLIGVTLEYGAQYSESERTKSPPIMSVALQPCQRAGAKRGCSILTSVVCSKLVVFLQSTLLTMTLDMY